MVAVSTIGGKYYQYDSANSAQRRIDNRPGVIEFKGSGTAADDAAFGQVAAIASANGLLIEISGTIQITSQHVLTGGKGIRGASGSMIEFGPSGQIDFGTYLSAELSGSSIAINALATPKSTLIVGASANALDNVGDYLVVLAANEVQEPYSRHRIDLVQASQEIVKVNKRVRTGAGTEDRNQIEIDGYLHDVYTSSPRVVDISPILLRDVLLENVNFTSLNKTFDGNIASNNETAFAFYNIVGLRIVNCKNISPAAGQVLIQSCYDWQVLGSKFETKLNADVASSSSGGNGAGYGITSGLSKSGLIEGCYGAFMRHFFTTTGAPGSVSFVPDTVANDAARPGTPSISQLVRVLASESNGNAQTDYYWDGSTWQILVTPPTTRSGQPRDIVLRNNTINNSFERDGLGGGSSHSSLDTHAEGVGIIFENNRIYLGDETLNGFVTVGIQSRSRETVIRNNQIYGPATASNKGISDAGMKTVIEGNEINGTDFTAIELASPAISGDIGPVGGGVVTRNRICNADRGIYARVACGDNYEISENSFENTTTAHIRLDAGTGWKIRNNKMTQQNSEVALLPYVGFDKTNLAEYSGNNLRGYANCSIGFDLDSVDGRELDSLWRKYNLTEQVKVVNLVTHVLDTNDDAFAPILADGSVLDDVAAGQTPIGIYGGHTGDGVCVYPAGSVLRIPANRLFTYSYSASTSLLWWDESSTDTGGRPGLYTPNAPPDTSSSPILRVLDQFATELLVEVLSPSSDAAAASEGSTLNSDVYADLATSSLVNGAYIDVGRYSASHTVGDGSGQTVKYDSTSSATVNGGFVFAGKLTNSTDIANYQGEWSAVTAYTTGQIVWHYGELYEATAATTGDEPDSLTNWAVKATTGRFLAVDQSQPINPYKFGGLADGTTNQTPIFKRIVDAKGIDGAHFYIPEGDWFFDGDLYLDNATYWFEGASRRGTRLLVTGGQFATRNFIQNANSTTPVEALTISNLTFVGRANSGDDFVAMVRVEKCGGAFFNQVDFIDVSTTAVEINSIPGMVAGTLGGVWVNQCRTWSTGAHVAAVWFKVNAATTFSMQECEAEDMARSYDVELDGTNGIDNCICVGNVFKNHDVSSKSTTNTAIPVHINAQFVGTYVRRGVISNNIFENNDTTGTTSQGYEIQITDSGSGSTLGEFTISNNISTGWTYDNTNFSVMVFVQNCDRLLQHGNQWLSPVQSGASPYRAIRITGVTNGSVSNETLEGPFDKGILIQSTTGVAAYDNTFIGSFTTDEIDTTGLVRASGSGTPEGSVRGAIGSTYTRTDGGSGTSFYVKESGTGNTGWAAASEGSTLHTDVYAGLVTSSVVNGSVIDVNRYSAAHVVGDGSGQTVKYESASAATVDGGFVFAGKLTSGTDIANFQGEWSSVTAYTIGQIVWYYGQVYEATAGTTGDEPASLVNWAVKATTGRFVAVDQTKVAVSRFGALAGSDMERPIVSALTSARTNAVTCVFDGDYTVDNWTPFTVGTSETLTVESEPGGSITLNNATAVDLFNQSGGSLSVTGLRMDSWRYSVFMATGTQTLTKLEGCTAVNQDGFVIDNGENTATCADFIVKNNSASTLSESFVRYRALTLGNVTVVGNHVSGLTSNANAVYGINIGPNQNAITSNVVNVSKNTLLTITGDAFDAYGILVNGPNVVCSDNTIKSVSVINSGSVAYGIYTKCLSPVVSGNHLENAGYGGTSENRGINCKGTERGEASPTTPWGYGAKVTDNTVFFDAGALGTNHAGIETWRREACVKGNHVEGCEIGILVLGAFSSVIGNVVADCSAFAMYMFDCSHVTFKDNHIFNLPNGSIPYEVRSSAVAITNVTIDGGSCEHNGTSNVTVVRLNCIGISIDEVAVDNINGDGWTYLVQPTGAQAAQVGRTVIKSGCKHDGFYYSGVNVGMIVENIRGTGTPESVVVSRPGGTYLREDGAAGTCLYVKESGGGTTGWVAK